MPKHQRIKNTDFELKLFQKRILILTIAVFALVGALVARLFFLQVIEHSRYTTLSNQNQLNLIPIEPTRGLIYDRNGVLLAENLPVFSLDVIPSKVKNLKATLTQLNKLIPLDEVTLKDFYKILPQKHRFDAVPLKLNLTETEVARYSINQWRFPGVIIDARLLRYYPLGPTVADAVGFMGRINQQELDQVDSDNYAASNYIGKIGTEKFYEDTLHGQVGYQQVETDAGGHVVRVLKRMPPIAGNTIYLTIDSGLEEIAEKSLGNLAGAVVAINPNNGDVLALVSNPSFDPNLFVEGMSTTAFQQLQNAPNRPLYNRAIRGLFAPGSTVKPFIALGGLGVGAVTPSYSISDPGFFVFGNHTYKDWRKGGHGVVNVQKAISVSCDTYFFNLAMRLGIKRLDDIYQMIGIGQKTGLDNDEEIAGYLPTPAWKRKAKGASWYTGDTIVAGIGQGYVLATPLQMVNAVGMIAMRGMHFQPHLLLKTVSPNGLISIYKPKQLTTLNFPQNIWTLVINGMHGIFTFPGGTGGHFGKDVAYPIAGKTGTAQVFSASFRKMSDVDQQNLPVQLRDNTWFIAFAPIDKPQIAIAVIVEHSKLAGDVARRVMDYYLLKEKHLPPEDLLRPLTEKDVNPPSTPVDMPPPPVSPTATPPNQTNIPNQTSVPNQTTNDSVTNTNEPSD